MNGKIMNEKTFHWVPSGAWDGLFCLLIVLWGGGSAYGQYTNNYQTNTITTATIWPGYYVVGSNTHHDVLQIVEGGSLTSSRGILGFESAGENNMAVVSGIGSVWTNTDNISVGWSGAANQLIISNAGQAAANTNVFVGYNSSATNNTVLVTGDGSLLYTPSLFVGRYGKNNLLTISDGGQVGVTESSFIGRYAGADNNTVLVTGSGTVWSTALSLSVGQRSAGNRLIVSNAAQVVNSGAFVGGGNYDPTTTANNNEVLITGAGSLWRSHELFIGNYGTNNLLTISDGGRVVVSNNSYVGRYAGADNNAVLVTGAGSLWQVPTLSVGSNSASKGVGSSVLIQDGGTLEANTLMGGWAGSGTISNRGGVYQFTNNTPTITPNTAGNIVISNGTIAYRGVASANIANNLGGMVFQGDNTFQLNSSSNAAGLASYKFDSVANTGTATNYQQLVLVNDGSFWRSGTLLIGAGGALLVSNSTATIAANLISTGSVKVVSSKLTFVSNVVVNGSYVSDPSTNIFLADLSLTAAGTLVGGSGDWFDFKQNFLIQSTNNTGFDLRQSAIRFSGGGGHTNAITGLDLGSNAVGYADNFAYGELHLGSISDHIYFTNLTAAANNALYINWIDLLGDVNGTNLVANLHAPRSINVYYDVTDSRNAYLTNFNASGVYQLSDWGGGAGGFLLPVAVPEPSTLALLMAAGLAMWSRRRRR